MDMSDTDTRVDAINGFLAVTADAGSDAGEDWATIKQLDADVLDEDISR